MKSILVIGGGLVGAASALRLQAAGVRVALIDPGDVRRGASYGNAGHIGAEQVAPWSAWRNIAGAPGRMFGAGGPLDFRWRDVGMWTPWSLRFMAACTQNARGVAALSALLRDAMGAWLRLADAAQMQGMVRQHGHANVWMRPRNVEPALKAWARTPIGVASYRDMAAHELARYEDVLTHAPVAGILFAGTGQVRDPQGARDAILRQFKSLGGEVVEGKVTRIRGSGGAQVTFATGETRDAEGVLVAAGAWSGALMSQLGAHAPVIGERGYSVQSLEHAWPENLPTTIFEERSVVLSGFTSGLRATSFLEFGSPDGGPDKRKWARLEAHLRQLGVKFAAEPDRWMGPRPTLPDYLPAIGRLKRAPHVLYAFGHAHLGLTMAPITSELVCALATDTPPSVDLQPFRIERF